MARPRKTVPSDPFSDLSKKAEILEREMNTQRAAIERLKQIAKPQPLTARDHEETHHVFAKRRASR